MIDRLLAWWNRPLEDAEHRRLFAFAALGLVVLAAVLIAQQRAAPEAPRPAVSAPLEAQPRRAPSRARRGANSRRGKRPSTANST